MGGILACFDAHPEHFVVTRQLALAAKRLDAIHTSGLNQSNARMTSAPICTNQS